MDTFKYDAMDSSGQEVTDTVEAMHVEDAISKIRDRGYFATQIVRQGEKKPTPVQVAVSRIRAGKKLKERVMSEKSSSSSGKSSGIGFVGLLTILFIALKLGVGNTAVMGWSWWWVISPIWISLGVTLGIIAIVMFVMLVLVLIGHWVDKLKD